MSDDWRHSAATRQQAALGAVRVLSRAVSEQAQAVTDAVRASAAAGERLSSAGARLARATRSLTAPRAIILDENGMPLRSVPEEVAYAPQHYDEPVNVEIAEVKFS